MDQIKKMFGGLSPMLAFIIHAAFATLFLVLYLVAPVYGAGYGAISGIKIFSIHPAAATVIMNLMFIFAPLAIMLVLTLKKKICPCFIYGLAYTFFIFMMGSNFIWGWGSIVNIFIVLLPWSAFAYFRKDLPASIM